MIQFTKMNGAGNDFIMIDNRNKKLTLEPQRIAQLCDRHRGIGADGILLVEPAEQGADFKMRYYNSDGSEAEMCGNGARCFARFAQRLSGKEGAIRFETLAGVIRANFDGDLIRLEMSPPQDLRLTETVEIDGETRPFSSINTGVPHVVIVVDDLEAVDVKKTGHAVRYHLRFAPRGTNVNFLQTLAPDHIAIRTYERGVEDETLACGTGVVASALVYSEITGGSLDAVKVNVKGGDTLSVNFTRATGGGFQNVTLTGPADFVFDGSV